MKKVIDKKVYNTETAELVASFRNMDNRTNFRFFEEELYVTKKGAFFLYGEGNALSQYSIPNGNGSSGGEDIVVLTAEETYDWLEKYNQTEAIEEYFADNLEEA